jgi:Transposase DDE domain group 1
MAGKPAQERGRWPQDARWSTYLQGDSESCNISGKNFAALTDLCGRWIDHVHGQRPPKAIVLDMDSSVSPTYGEQEGTSYNGHFGCTCYHPLFVFNQFGDLERCALRSGNVHSADGWHDVLEPVVARYRKRNMRRRRYGTSMPQSRRRPHHHVAKLST